MTAVAAPAKTSRPLSVGTMIDRMWELREQKKKLDDEAKDISAKMTELEEQLSAKMEADGVTKATGKSASVSFSFTTAAQVQGDEGWALLYGYIKRTGYWHLLQRRVTDTAYKELLDAGKKVPGVEPFSKKRINLRTLTA